MNPKYAQVCKKWTRDQIIWTQYCNILVKINSKNNKMMLKNNNKII